MRETPVVIKIGGGQVLGMLHLPRGASARRKCPAVLFLHGFTGSRHEAHRLFVLTARALAQAGIASLRIDFRGSGDSSGDFSEMTIESELQDAVASLRFLRRRPEVDTKRIGLLGMSMGGLVASLLASQEKIFKRVLLWAPVGNPRRLVEARYTAQSQKQLAETGITDYIGWPVSRAFIEDILQRNPSVALATYKGPAMIIHGDQDSAVPFDESDLYINARCAAGLPVERVTVHGADHTFSSLPWTDLVVTRSTEWFRAL